MKWSISPIPKKIKSSNTNIFQVVQSDIMIYHRGKVEAACHSAFAVKLGNGMISYLIEREVSLKANALWINSL